MKRIVLFLTILLAISAASALKNPSAVYCEALGYEYVIYSTPLGEVGKCILPNGEAVNAWDFYTGRVAVEYSYCTIKGYEAKHVETESCPNCLVCVLPNGTEVEVGELMNLQLEETTCGDGVCGIPENYSSCPQDCKSGSEDGYCDAVKDGICDPDCMYEKDPDCVEEEIATTTETTTETPVAKSTPGFEFAIAVTSISVYLLLRRF